MFTAMHLYMGCKKNATGVNKCQVVAVLRLALVVLGLQLSVVVVLRLNSASDICSTTHVLASGGGCKGFRPEAQNTYGPRNRQWSRKSNRLDGLRRKSRAQIYLHIMICHSVRRWS
jgi:hypothetical protein